MASFPFFNSAKDVWNYIGTFNQLKNPPPTALVLKIYIESSKNAAATASKLNTCLSLNCNKESLSSLRLSVNRSHKRLNILLKCLKHPKGNEELVTFLTSKFQLPSLENSSGSFPVSSTRVLKDTTNIHNNLALSHLQVHEKTRNGCKNCEQIKSDFSQEVACLKMKLWQVKNNCKNICLQYNVKKVNQQFKRYTKQIGELRKKCSLLQRTNRLLSRRLETKLHTHQRLHKNEKSLKRKLFDVEEKVHHSAEKVRKLNKDVKDMEWEAAQRDREEFGNSSSRIFCDAMRKCIYYCLISHVPIEATGRVIQYITECQGNNVSNVPHPTTISRCSYELAILCDVQCGEFLINAESLTLAWDATTLKGNHINQIVISSKEKFMTLATDLLPGGTSEDYANHLTQAVENISKIYAKFSGQDALFLMNRIIRKFCCTLTDRASVNHCTAVRLMAKLDINLLELNCQLHPLEAFASAARDALLDHEKATFNRRSQTFGQTAGAVNVITAISKLRFKDGKGDPAGFKAFIKAQRIDSSLLPRYVGNRLHVIFHLGGSILYLKDKLLSYLKTQCSQQKLRLALIDDLSNANIIRHLQVLGLFGKVFTGPWMREIYSSLNDRDHMRKTLKVLSSLDVLGKVKHNPELLFTTKEDAFGKELSADDVLVALKDTSSDRSHILEAITLVASKVHSRLEKQLQKYRENPAYCPSDEQVQEISASAAVHNMVCERGLGMIDCLMRRAPNSQIKTIDAKVRGQLNKTMDWLESSKSQQTILSFARKAGAIIRSETVKQKANIELKILKRQQERGQLRDMAERKKKEKEVRKAIDEDDMEHLLEGVSGECISFIREILNGVCGRKFQHLWSTADGTDDLYYAQVKKFGKSQKEKRVKISYWQIGDENFESDAIEYQITLQSLITDAILGDIIV